MGFVELIGIIMGDVLVFLIIIFVVRYFWKKRKNIEVKVNATEFFVRNLPDFTADEWLIAGDGSRAIAIDKNRGKLAVVWNQNQYRIFSGNEIKDVIYLEDGHRSFTQEGMFSETKNVSVGSIGFTVSFYDLNFTSFSFLVGGRTNVGSELYKLYKNRAIHWCNMIDILKIQKKGVNNNY